MTEPEVPRVFIGQPQYGPTCPQAVLALHQSIERAAPAEDRVVIAHSTAVGSSLLPQTFNMLLCAALDARDSGAVSHFAMLHADIWPERGWLTKLWRAMRACGADLVSAVVPIKQPPPVPTSTGIGLWSDPWAVQRYVQVGDRAAMAETFGAEICGEGEVLLVNTGCFLADLRHPAWDQFAEAGGFAFETRIERDEETGRRMATIQPEDWRMSRFLQERGARLAATWSVSLRHGGWGWWDNE